MLPFLHIKFSLAAFLSGGLLLWQWRRMDSRPNRITFIQSAMILTTGAAGIVWFNVSVYGAIMGPSGHNAGWYLQELLPRYLRYWWDDQLGILAQNALILWALPGCFVLYRRAGWRAWILLLVILSAHAPNILHDVWWLGSCPAGRYWVAAYPLLAFVAALGVHGVYTMLADKRSLRFLMYVVLLLQIFHSLRASYRFATDRDLFYLREVSHWIQTSPSEPGGSGGKMTFLNRA